MDSFVFALDTTMPVFLVILLGWFLRRVGVLNEAFCKPADHYVFKCALPVSLFLSIAKMDVYSDFDPLFCLFCFTVTAIVFLGVWALTSRLMKDKALVGEFSQAAVRSSAAILGVALNTNIYGNAGMVPMMVLSAVPFFNVYAVLILQFSPHTDENGRLIPPERNGAAAVKRALVNVVKNPIILGILLGVPFSLLRVKLLRALGLTVGQIKAIVRGETELDAALSARIAAIQKEKAALDRAGEIAGRLRQAHAQFRTLDARPYLDEMQTERVLERDTLPKEHFPWQRFFARLLDGQIYRTLWMLLLPAISA